MNSRSRQQIIKEALRLAADERLALAAELLNSVEGSDVDCDAAWSAELQRRVDEATQDPSSLEDGVSVKVRLLGELRSK
jgi:putative addiction module component (TIGR02574 family)